MYKKNICIMLSILMICSLSLSGCKKNNKNAKEIINNSVNNFLNLEKIESGKFKINANIDIDEESKNYVFNESYEVDTITNSKNPKVRVTLSSKLIPFIVTELISSDEIDFDKIKALDTILYLDNDYLVYSFNHIDYYKISLKTLVDNETLKQEDIDKFKTNITKVINLDLSDEEKNDLKENIKPIIDIFNNYTVEGTKTINDKKCNIIKGKITIIDFKNIVEIVNKYNKNDDNEKSHNLFSLNKDDLKNIPDNIAPINVEIYSTEKDDNIIGCKLDFANFYNELTKYTEEDLKKLNENEIEESQSDFIYSIQEEYVINVCNIIGLSTDTNLNEFHDEILEEVWKIVKDVLWKKFTNNRNKNKNIIIIDAGVGAGGCNDCKAKILGETLEDKYNENFRHGLFDTDDGFYVQILEDLQHTGNIEIGEIWKVNSNCKYKIIE